MTLQKICSMISKYEKTPHFNRFLMSIKIFKQVQKDPIMFNNWKVVAANMRQNEPSDTHLSTGESLELINNNLVVENNITLHDLKFLIKKEIIFANMLNLGNDSIGRKKVVYEIPKTEIENYIALMKLFEIGEDFGYFKKDNHPKTGDDIVIYQKMINDKNGLSKPEIKLDIVFRLLQKVEFQNFLAGLVKNNIV